MLAGALAAGSVVFLQEHVRRLYQCSAFRQESALLEEEQMQWRVAFLVPHTNVRIRC